jgi:uncharacterized metal-binding protein YceD (DUF177 family)
VNIYTVNIIGLSLKAHSFDYHLNEDFFKRYGSELLSSGDFQAQVVLNKNETFIEADFSIKGNADLICDRSLEPFQFPIEVHKKVMFKYGEEAGEINDEVIVITRDQATLELGQLMYEFIGIEIPMKKLHPRFQEIEDDEFSEGKIVYTSEKPEDDEPIDPRWEILKKLK